MGPRNFHAVLAVEDARRYLRPLLPSDHALVDLTGASTNAEVYRRFADGYRAAWSGTLDQRRSIIDELDRPALQALRLLREREGARVQRNDSAIFEVPRVISGQRRHGWDYARELWVCVTAFDTIAAVDTDIEWTMRSSTQEQTGVGYIFCAADAAALGSAFGDYDRAYFAQAMNLLDDPPEWRRELADS